MDEKNKKDLLIFTSPSFRKPKKWISLIMALVFFCSTLSPAFARSGNYGENTPLELFLLGGLSAAVTDVCILMGYGYAAVAGSVASNLVSLYIYYSDYHSSGETIMSFKIFGVDVEISKQAFWSMVAGCVAGSVAGWIAGGASGGASSGAKGASSGAKGASSGATSGATSGTASGAAAGGTAGAVAGGTAGAVSSATQVATQTVVQTIVQRILDLIKRLIASFITMVIRKFVEEFAVQKLHMKRLWAQAMTSIMELGINIAQNLLFPAEKVVKVEKAGDSEKTKSANAQGENSAGSAEGQTGTSSTGSSSQETIAVKVTLNSKGADGNPKTLTGQLNLKTGVFTAENGNTYNVILRMNPDGTTAKIKLDNNSVLNIIGLEGNKAGQAASPIKTFLSIVGFFTGAGVDIVLNKAFGKVIGWILGTKTEGTKTDGTQPDGTKTDYYFTNSGQSISGEEKANRENQRETVSKDRDAIIKAREAMKAEEANKVKDSSIPGNNIPGQINKVQAGNSEQKPVNPTVAVMNYAGNVSDSGEPNVSEDNSSNNGIAVKFNSAPNEAQANTQNNNQPEPNVKLALLTSDASANIILAKNDIGAAPENKLSKAVMDFSGEGENIARPTVGTAQIEPAETQSSQRVETITDNLVPQKSGESMDMPAQPQPKAGDTYGDGERPVELDNNNADKSTIEQPKTMQNQPLTNDADVKDPGNTRVSSAPVKVTPEEAKLNPDQRQRLNNYAEWLKNTGDLPRDNWGRPLQDLPIRDAVLGELRSHGYVGAVRTIATTAILDLLGWDMNRKKGDMYSGSDKNKKYKDTVSLILANAGGDIVARILGNGDYFNTSFSSEVKSVILHNTTNALASIALARLGKNWDLASPIQSTIDLAGTSLVDAAVDTIKDTGSTNERTIGATDNASAPGAVSESPSFISRAVDNYTDSFVDASLKTAISPNPYISFGGSGSDIVAPWQDGYSPVDPINSWLRGIAGVPEPNRDNSRHEKLDEWSGSLVGIALDRPGYLQGLWQNNQDRWESRMENAANGVGPIMSQAYSMGSNLNNQATSQLSNSTIKAFGLEQTPPQQPQLPQQSQQQPIQQIMPPEPSSIDLDNRPTYPDKIKIKDGDYVYKI